MLERALASRRQTERAAVQRSSSDSSCSAISCDRVLHTEVATRMAQLRLLVFFSTLLVLTACEPGGPVGGSPAPRFEVHAVQASGGPLIVRFDTATGALQTAPLVGARNWTALGEPAAATSAPGRFSFNFVAAKSIQLTFIRVDTETGDAWRMAFPRDRDWVSLRSPGQRSAAPPEASAKRRREPRPAVVPAPVADVPVAASKPKIGRSAADIPAYVEGLESENIPAGMRAWAVEQLGNVESDEAVPPLLGALEYEDPIIVRSAIRALAKHDDARVKPALKKMTQHEVPEIARVAKKMLRDLN